MEMQFFVGSGPEHYAFWKDILLKWHHRLGLVRIITASMIISKQHTMLMLRWILSLNFLLGLKIRGDSPRTDFDLKQHDLEWKEITSV